MNYFFGDKDEHIYCSYNNNLSNYNPISVDKLEFEEIVKMLNHYISDNVPSAFVKNGKIVAWTDQKQIKNIRIFFAKIFVFWKI